MPPAVPFALLAVVQLTSVAGWLGLAAAALLPRLRRRVGPALVPGALCLAVADALALLEFGTARSAPLSWLRVAGLALFAIAALLGPAGRRPRRRPAPATSAMPLAAVVAPLGAAVRPALVAGALGLLAAAALAPRAGWLPARWPAPGRLRLFADRTDDRVIARALLVAALLTGFAASLGAVAGGSAVGALAELAVRAGATLALFFAEWVMTRPVLVGKLVGGTVAAVVTMAVVSVAVVGVSVSGAAQADQASRLLAVARSEQAGFDTVAARATRDAAVVARCGRAGGCGRLLRSLSGDPAFFALTGRPGHGWHVVATRHVALRPGRLRALAAIQVVRAALSGPPAQPGSAAVVTLPGRPRLVTVVGAAAARNRFPAAVYGVVFDRGYLARLHAETGYDVSLVTGGRLLASSLAAAARRPVLAGLRRARREGPTTGGIRQVAALGHAPLEALVPVRVGGAGRGATATLVLSQPAGRTLAAQRRALRRLVLTALIVLALAALLALVMANRVADPLRRLTAAAGQVRRGELDTAAAVSSPDELGLLGRAFDDMTASLRRLTGDLRAAASTEAALRSRVESVVAAMTDGVVTVDAEGRIVAANDEALRLVAAPPERLIGAPIAEAVDIRDGDDAPLLPADQLAADGVLRRETGAVAVHVAVAPLPAGGAVVTLSDRSREREVERLKTEFLSNVSHELRTPLTPIKGYAEMLARRPDLDDDQVGRFAGEILSAADRMSRVVALLVDVAALDAGRVVPQRCPVAVADVIDPVLAAWRERWPERAADLRRSLARQLPAVDVDLTWVHKALTELVDNAIKLTASGSPITVRAEPVGTEHVRVKVVDRGPGLPEATVGDLLGDFSQADASETRRVPGLGLGLGFVRRVAERFGLGLYVCARRGRGSEFGLDLPVATAEQASPRAVAPRER
jgi:two-component system sensor histidine kinase ResE